MDLQVGGEWGGTFSGHPPLRDYSDSPVVFGEQYGGSTGWRTLRRITPDTRRGMDEITVNKAELRAKVEENRKAHRAIFEEAVKGYHQQSLELLQQHIDEIKEGKVIRISVSLPFPEDHTRDYDRVLAMLDMMIEDEVTIDEETFASYVMDDWHWKRAFLTSNAFYSSMAAASL